MKNTQKKGRYHKHRPDTRPTTSRQRAAHEGHHAYTLEEILGDGIQREQALAAICADPETHRIFSGFPPDDQERLVAFIQGAQGLKVTYVPGRDHGKERPRIHKGLPSLYPQGDYIV